MRRTRSTFLVAVLLSIAGLAHAQPAPDPALQAQQAVEQGNQLYAQGRYQEALQQFDTARRITPDPVLDLDVARCYDALGDSRSAVENYSRYVHEAPQNPDVAEVRACMHELKQQLRAQQQQQQMPPQQPYPQQPPPQQPYPQQPYPQQQQYPPPQYSYQQPAPPPPPPRFFPRHVIGFGTSIGVNWFGASTYDSSGNTTDSFNATSFIFGDLNLYIGLSRRVELQLWIPIANMALSTSFCGCQSETLGWADLFLKIYTRPDSAGFFLAPGVGFQYIDQTWGDGFENRGGALELAFQFGYEWASQGRGFSLSLSGRPFLDIFSLSDNAGNSGGALGLGLMANLGVNFYITRR